MKQKIFTKGKTVMLIVVTMLFVSAVNAQTRGSIAVLDFQTGANITRSQVEGVSDMFLTFFNPQGFALVERTQINRVMAEQRFQHTSITDADAVRLGRILNVNHIVLGRMSIMGGRYQLDVRVINVQTGAIIARDGTEWGRNASPREPMRGLANRLAQRIPPPPPPPAPVMRF